MNGFISHIINRHLHADMQVAPRLPARFEPPAVSAIPAWQQGENFIDSSQTSFHSDKGTSIESNYLQTQESPIAESLTQPVVKNIKKTKYITGEENPQPSFVAAANRNDSLQGERANVIEFVPSPLHAVPDTVAATTINPAQQPGSPLIYQATPADKQVKGETGEKSPPVISRDLSKTVPEKRHIRPPSSVVTPVPFVVPAARHSNTALRFGVSGLQAQQTPQVIKVSIGRIEVKAVQATGPVKTARVEPPKPKLSLDEYLNKRNSTR